ncbi:MAG: hypothetical protein JWO46_2975 [Nocardioidaceae bacterium]|nr:hypothetical protein [Nocardioidaceae bacterium]
MARRTIYWHIGPDDLGTAFVGDALDAHREQLAAAGVLVAGTPHAWELATAELRRSHQQLGYDLPEVEGQNATLVRRLWKHKGTTVLSTPGLASATRDQVLLALDGIRGAEIHLVLVVRDLTSQVNAACQAALEQGATSRPDKYAARVLDPESTHEQAAAFRAGHDLPDVLRRWTRTVLPEHVHIIGATDPAEIWTTFLRLLGAPDLALPEGIATGQLGPAQLTVLRDVALALDEQLDTRARRTALRDWLSRGLLPHGTGGPAVDSGDLLRTWTDLITTKGFDMHGTLRDQSGDTNTTGPSSEESATAALAEALVELGRLQQENAALVEENVRLDRKRRKHKRRAQELEKQQQGAA